MPREDERCTNETKPSTKIRAITSKTIGSYEGCPHTSHLSIKLFDKATWRSGAEQKKYQTDRDEREKQLHCHTKQKIKKNSPVSQYWPLRKTNKKLNSRLYLNFSTPHKFGTDTQIHKNENALNINQSKSAQSEQNNYNHSYKQPKF